jgi:SEC-C motif
LKVDEGMMEKRKRSQDELTVHLNEQLNFLEASARAYDSGYESESKRMAVVLRVLLHDKKNSKSLLGQLGRKGTWFWDTAAPDSPNNLLPYGGLVAVQMTHNGVTTDGDYHAPLDDVPFAKRVPFDTWWHATVFRAEGAVLTRSDVVLTAADQDGGADVDPALEEQYARFQHDNAFGWEHVDGSSSTPLAGAVGVALRQMTHEVLRTMGRTQVASPEKPPPAKVGRNDPCPCGKGKKYKKCCGA